MANDRITMYETCTRWVLAASIGEIAPPPRGCSENILYETIRRGKLQGLVWHHLRGAQGAGQHLSAAHVESLERRVRYLTFMHLHQSRLQRRIGAALNHRNITTVVLKGAAIAPLVYPDASLRSTNDLDLLVSLTDEDRAADVLRELGGVEHNLFPRRPASRRAYHERVFTFTLDGHLTLLVELHTGFAQSFRHPIDYDAWIDRSRTHDGHLRRLSDEDQLVHFAIHSGRELFMGPLKQLVDTHLWVTKRTIDWDLVIRRARSSEAEYMLFELLRMAQNYMGTAVPRSALSACAPPYVSRRLFERVHRPSLGRLCAPGFSQRALECLTLFPLLSTPLQRTRFLHQYVALRLKDLWERS